MATVINKRDADLQASGTRTVSVNLGSNVNVNGTINNQPVANVTNHIAATGNVHGVTLTQINGDLDDIADGSNYFRTTANQVTGAGRAFNALNTSSEYIRSLKSTQLTVVGSNPSTGWVGDANGIRMYQSGSLKVNIPVSGDPSFSGDISGASNIDITGKGVFRGMLTTSGHTASVVANPDGAGGGFGLYAESGSSTFAAISAVGVSNGTGIIGTATGSSGIGVTANNGAGIGLQVIGRMTITSTTLVSNLNADLLDGKQGTAYCQGSNTNSGLATVSGNVLNIQVTGTLNSTVRTRASGNAVVIENISDESLKQDIEDEEYGLEFINALRPRSFRMKTNPLIRSHGLIYQEVIGLVSEDDSLASLNSDNETGAVDYNGIVSPMIKAIQELSQQVKHINNFIGA
jgi:hypothetical protein